VSQVHNNAALFLHGLLMAEWVAVCAAQGGDIREASAERKGKGGENSCIVKDRKNVLGHSSDLAVLCRYDPILLLCESPVS
jgi:hypothetical protein